MSLTEQLLKKDIKVQELKKDVKMNLQKLGRQEFIFTIGEIDAEYTSELQEGTLKIKGKSSELNGTYDVKIKVILEGCPELKDKKIRDHFGCATPKNLIEKIMTAGEIDKLYEEIQDLNGYTEEDDIKKKRK